MANTYMPDKHRGRDAWELAWQEQLDDYWAPAPPPLAVDPRFTQRAEAFGPQRDGILIREETNVEICKLQDDLAETAVRALAQDNFEAKWVALPDARRRELVLEGIYRPCSAVVRVEKGRKWCPDVTVLALCMNGGRAYVDMLRALLPNTVGSLTQAISVPHVTVDAHLAVPSGEDPASLLSFVLSGYAQSRTYTVSITVWNVLLAFVRLYGSSVSDPC
jgi:hypothetical protein